MNRRDLLLQALLGAIGGASLAPEAEAKREELYLYRGEEHWFGGRFKRGRRYRLKRRIKHPREQDLCLIEALNPDLDQNGIPDYIQNRDLILYFSPVFD